jgi:hypothetical protein
MRFHYRQKVSVAILAFICVAFEINKGLIAKRSLAWDFHIV